MEKLRKPLQGVINILRFNWHFYAMAAVVILILLLAAAQLHEPLKVIIYLFCLLVWLPVIISLLVSLYVYDLSGLYDFTWIGAQLTPLLVVNINAGFDETSALLQQRFHHAELVALDFYDAAKHTELSIKRARKAYPPFPGTKQVQTNNLPLPDHSADKVFVIFSAHEIRNEKERIDFFRELRRIIKPGGQIFITEHLRDVPNFLAYYIGFFHFYSHKTWLRIFNTAGLSLQQEIKNTPFISTFTLGK